jgi:hypothetical protein
VKRFEEVYPRPRMGRDIEQFDTHENRGHISPLPPPGPTNYSG